MSASYEEAKLCPTCTMTGKMEKRVQGMQVFVCMNERCQHFMRTWVVEPNPDGTIPDPNRLRDRGQQGFKTSAPSMAAINNRIERLRERADTLPEYSSKER